MKTVSSVAELNKKLYTMLMMGQHAACHIIADAMRQDLPTDHRQATSRLTGRLSQYDK